MRLKQVSVFLENRSGRLKEMTEVLGDNDINIRALFVADAAEFGVVRLVVNKPHDATRVLEESGFAVKETDVFAVEVEDVPGGLGMTLGPLAESGMNIDYLYCFLEKAGDKAVVIVRVGEELMDRAIASIENAGYRIVPEEELYGL